MPFQTTYESFGEIPERVSDLYEERDGGWHFALEIDGEIVSDELIGQIEARVDDLVNEQEVLLEEARATIPRLEAENERLRADAKQAMVAKAIRAAGNSSGILPGALDDCFLAADAVGAIVDDDDIVTIGGYSPNEWLLKQRDERPHWFHSRPQRRRLF